jgi:hypothetical protein
VESVTHFWFGPLALKALFRWSGAPSVSVQASLLTTSVNWMCLGNWGKPNTTHVLLRGLQKNRESLNAAEHDP